MRTGRVAAGEGPGPKPPMGFAVGIGSVMPSETPRRDTQGRERAPSMPPRPPWVV